MSYQVNITLPTKQHNGVSNMSIIEEIKKSLATRYGGFSSMLISGGWVNNGHLYEDTSVLVWTIVKHEEDVSALVEAAQGWALDLKQIELLVTFQEIGAVFVQGTREQAVA